MHASNTFPFVTSYYMSGKFSDQFLIASSIAGDEEAFGKLYDKYVNDIYRFVVMRVRSSQEAQDLASETFLKAWQYVSTQKKQIDDFRALLYRIARNLVIDHYRSSKNESQGFEEGQLENIIDTSPSLQASAEHKDDMALVFKVIGQLSKDDSDVIILRYIEDLSIKEIAEIQGKKSGTVRVALHRAVKRVKELISEL